MKTQKPKNVNIFDIMSDFIKKYLKSDYQSSIRRNHLVESKKKIDKNIIKFILFALFDFSSNVFSSQTRNLEIKTRGDVIKTIEDFVVVFRKQTQDFIKKSSNLDPTFKNNQLILDSVLIDFINYSGLLYGLDMGYSSKYLWATPIVCSYHDDSPCYEKLGNGGYCHSCGFHPDMQSVALKFFCSHCKQGEPSRKDSKPLKEEDILLTGPKFICQNCNRRHQV